MPNYRRSQTPGATYFFTLTLQDRRSALLVDEIDRFRAAYAAVHGRHPFQTLAICVLPDHLHAIWRLPENDAAYSLRWQLIKRGFSRGLDNAVTRTPSRIAKREKGIWQRRYWEHQIRDELDLARHVDYIHFNPVKHGLVQQAAAWPHSSLHRWIARGDLPASWGLVAPAAGAFGE